MKDALAWWTREFLDGMKAEVGLPIDWSVIRTILIFAEAGKKNLPKVGDSIYFEIPDGIEQIQSLKTETHLILFEHLPADPLTALNKTTSAHARFTCATLGAENKQGNAELKADWEVDASGGPILRHVPTGALRPATTAGMQQVRAEVKEKKITPYEYFFDSEKKAWDPEYADDRALIASDVEGDGKSAVSDPDDRNQGQGWRLVSDLIPREVSKERDILALEKAKPESGSFLLVSLRRRRVDRKL
jgi:hypothetical protein